MNVLEKLGLGPTRSHTRTDNGWLVEVKPPRWSHFAPSRMLLDDDQFRRYQKWLRGEGMIQDLLPELNNDEREILMTGIGSEEWDENFRDDE